MSSSYRTGSMKFVITAKNGTKFVGKCYAMSVNQSLSFDEGMKTTIQFIGEEVREILPSKKKKAKKAVKRKRG